MLWLSVIVIVKDVTVPRVPNADFGEMTISVDTSTTFRKLISSLKKSVVSLK